MWKDPEKRKAYYKKYDFEHKEELQKYRKEYREKNKAKLKQNAAEYRKKNKDKLRELNNKYQRSHKEECRAYRFKFKDKRLGEWEKVIPKHTACEICGAAITFNGMSIKESIRFDHRHEGSELIQGDPSKWLMSNICNEENIKIWRSCDFGMLCNSCNPHLPTVNRVEWLEKALKYAKTPLI